MDRNLDLPRGSKKPSTRILNLLDKYEIGEVLDSGRVSSEWSSGHAIMTDLGVALCSPYEGDAVGVAWHEMPTIELRPIVSDDSTEVTFPIDGGSITFKIDSRLLVNIKAAHEQLWLSELEEHNPGSLFRVGQVAPTVAPRPPAAVRKARALRRAAAKNAPGPTGPLVPPPYPDTDPTKEPGTHKSPLFRRLWSRITS